MTDNYNFKWLKDDIDSTLVIKITSDNFSNKENYGIYCVYDVLENDWDKLLVKFANIDDLTNLLTLGVVRFINVIDNKDILDVPFRNLYKLYNNANVLGAEQKGKLLSFKELEVFSVMNDVVRDDLMIYSAVVDRVSDELLEIMKIASEFSGYGMQQKFDALSKITYINHQRLIEDKKNNIVK